MEGLFELCYTEYYASGWIRGKLSIMGNQFVIAIIGTGFAGSALVAFFCFIGCSFYKRMPHMPSFKGTVTANGVVLCLMAAYLAVIRRLAS
jgi:hypothetical protein